MMSLCRTVHNLLRFPDPDDRCQGMHRPRRCSPLPPDAAGLRCVAVEIPRPPPHVVESAAIGPRTPLNTSSSSSSPSLSPSPSPQPQQEEQQQQPAERIDDGSRGLSYLYGRGGGGSLELCTESLGFESCCDGRMGAEEERAEQEIRRRIEDARRRSPSEQRGDVVPRSKARSTRPRTEAKEFPPPLTWLSGGGSNGGRCTTFLKAVRKDGRFLLAEVRIDRPEVLRASRRDGRLRLELIKPEPEAVEDEETAELEEDVAEKALGVEEGEEEAIAEAAAKTAKEEEEGEKKREEKVAAEGEKEPRWRLPEGGGGFRSGRCQEVVREGLPSSPFWGSQFVTTA